MRSHQSSAEVLVHYEGCCVVALISLLAAAMLCGCAGTPIPAETAARSELAEVSQAYRPAGDRPTPEQLGPAPGLADFLRFAMLNDPAIEAAYHDWAAAVERITGARSYPDPRLTFRASIGDMVEAVVPGLMMEFPGPGKRGAAGLVAATDSDVARVRFETQVLRTAFAVKSAAYRIRFLEESIVVRRESLAVLRELEQAALRQQATGRGSLQDVLRMQIELERGKTRLASLEDARAALRAEFKAALGLPPEAPDPPMPTNLPDSDASPDADAILETARERNPTIREMAAGVRRAEAMLNLARKAGVPDFSLGIEADLRASPFVWMPSAGMTLPVWRDRIAAEVAAAQADRHAADARLDDARVRFGAEFAGALYAYRESLRNLDLLGRLLLPKADQSLQVVRTGYAAGKTGFLEAMDAYRNVLEFRLEYADARTQRELSLASLSLLIAGIPPAGSQISMPAPAERTAP